MVRTLFSFGLVFFLSVYAVAENTDGGHGSSTSPQASPTPTSTPNARPEGDADAKLKEKATVLFKDVFSSVPESTLKDDFVAKLPPAMANAKNGNFDDISNILTPLFGTLDNKQFADLIKKTDAAEKKENEEGAHKEGVTDNKFLDLIDLIKKYEKGVKLINKDDKDVKKALAEDPSVKDEKDKTAIEKFQKDATDQQKKNKELLAKVDEINRLKKANKPDQQAQIDKLQKDLIGTVNQKAALAFIQDKISNGGSDAVKQVGRDLRDALALKSESGHNFLDTFWKGQPERIHLGSDSATADKAFAAYAKARGNFAATSIAPTPHQQPKNFFVDDQGNLKENAMPQGFKFTPPASVVSQPTAAPKPTQGPQQQQKQQSGGGNVTAASIVTDLTDPAKCGKCHKGSNKLTSNNASDLRRLRINTSLSAADVLKTIDNNPSMHASSNPKFPAAARADIAAWVKAVGG